MIKLHLPYPPSVWDIYVGWGKTRRQSPEYVAWIENAGWSVKGKWQQISVPFVCDIALKRPNKRQDIDNRAKPILDLLKHYGVIKNDNLCERLSMRWDAGLPVDCVVIIQPFEEALAA